MTGRVDAGPQRGKTVCLPILASVFGAAASSLYKAFRAAF
ncbi:hypothetical protein BH11ACT7_BH11ACT7_20350 [soil metagenome]